MSLPETAPVVDPVVVVIICYYSGAFDADYGLSYSLVSSCSTIMLSGGFEWAVVIVSYLVEAIVGCPLSFSAAVSLSDYCYDGFFDTFGGYSNRDMILAIFFRCERSISQMQPTSCPPSSSATIYSSMALAES